MIHSIHSGVNNDDNPREGIEINSSEIFDR